MKITRATSRAWRLPLQRKLMSSSISMTHRELVLVQIETSTGLTGTGWCTTAGVGGGSIKALIDGYLLPSLAGEDPRANERIWKRLWGECHAAGAAGITTLALATIDIALWDIKGKAAGEPLHRLLGGARDAIDVYASAINLHLDRAALLAQVEGHLAEGYSAFKLKVGRADPAEDLDRVRAVRAMIGSGRTLMLDANQKWAVGEAVQRTRALAETAPLFIEEPLLSDDVGGHRQLRLSGGIPVALGEQVCNRYEFWNYIREGAADYVQPDVGKVGGITEWIKIAALAEAANVALSPHGAIELSAQLACAVPNALHVENIFGLGLAEIGATTAPLAVERGRLRPGDAPGHGVVFDGPALAPANELIAGAAIRRESIIHSGM